MHSVKYSTAHLTLNLPEYQTRGYISTMYIAYRFNLRYKHYIVHYRLWTGQGTRMI